VSTLSVSSTTTRWGLAGTFVVPMAWVIDLVSAVCSLGAGSLEHPAAPTASATAASAATRR
jgi:hypothetical protein